MSVMRRWWWWCIEIKVNKVQFQVTSVQTYVLLNLSQFIAMCVKAQILCHSCWNEQIAFFLSVWEKVCAYMDGWDCSSPSLLGLWCFNESGRCCCCFCWRMNSLKCEMVSGWNYLPLPYKGKFQWCFKSAKGSFVRIMLPSLCWWWKGWHVEIKITQSHAVHRYCCREPF